MAQVYFAFSGVLLLVLSHFALSGMALLGCDVVTTDQVEVLPLLMRNVERNTSRITQMNSGLVWFECFEQYSIPCAFISSHILNGRTNNVCHLQLYILYMAIQFV